MAASVLDEVKIVGNVKLDADDSKAYFKGDGDRSSRFQFSVAVTPRGKNPSTNQWEDGVTTWHNYITVWGPMADNAHASLKNGDQVIILGHNRTRKYTDKEGNDKVATNIEVDFLGLSLRWGTASLDKGGINASSNRPSHSEPAKPKEKSEAPAASNDPFGDDSGYAGLFDD